MGQKPPEVANAAINIGLKLHESEDFYQAMTAAVSEIEKNCGVARCAIYTVNKSTRECCMINDEGLQNESMQSISEGMGRTPFEVAEAWEKDLELSDCLMLEELNVIAERDPIWYESLMKNDINNIILYAVRNNQELVGFIWAINFDISRKEIIKEIFEVCSFVIRLMSVCTSTSRNTTDCIPKRTDADRNGQSQIVTENIAAALSYDAEPVNIIQ